MNENEEGNESEGCDGKHENSLGPFVEIVVGEWDVVGRRKTTMMKRGENEGDQGDNVVEGGQGG